nr:hypothetical protein [Candidatus Sigynarchaeota archaeon]
KYARPLAILRHLPDYADFDWRCPGRDYDRISVNRKTPFFDNLLRKVLSMKMPKDKYIIKKDDFGTTLYLNSARRRAKWTQEKNRAKRFYYATDAEKLKKCYTNADDWIIEGVA